MNYFEFLTRICDDGIAASADSYKDDPVKRLAAEAGFNACRGKTGPQLAQLLARATRVRHKAFGKHDHDRYWRVRIFEAEVEWVANCISAILLYTTAGQLGKPIVPVTARAVMKAAQVLGVASLPPKPEKAA